MLDGPATLETAADRFLSNTDLLSPSSERLSSPVELDDVVRPTVPSLGRAIRPAAVLGRIRAVVIDPVEGASNRARTHIGAEVLEGLTPPIANRDPAPAVICERAVVLGLAARAERSPRIPFRRLAQPVLEITDRKYSRRGSLHDVDTRAFISEAPATEGCSLPKRRGVDCFLGAAAASTPAARLPVFPPLSHREYGETSIDFAREVKFLWVHAAQLNTLTLEKVGPSGA